MSFFGGFQDSTFQNDYQTTLIVVDPGPSLITFLPVSTRAQVPERSDYYVQIAYLDIFGMPYVPVLVQWRVWDATNHVQLQDWVTISDVGESTLLNLPAAWNTFGYAQSQSESREVIFWIQVSGGAQRYDTAVYSVIAVPDEV